MGDTIQRLANMQMWMKIYTVSHSWLNRKIPTPPFEHCGRSLSRSLSTMKIPSNQSEVLQKLGSPSHRYASCTMTHDLHRKGSDGDALSPTGYDVGTGGDNVVNKEHQRCRGTLNQSIIWSKKITLV